MKTSRPKIISHYQSGYGLAILVRKSILWPCYAYKVTIPRSQKRALNIFEQTILRLTAIGTGDSSRLADLTCMEKELVLFIQRRLHHLDMLDSRYEITKAGQELLDSWDEEPELYDAYINATVYVDACSGQLLPYVQTRPEQYQEIMDIDRDSLKFRIGSHGKADPVRAHIIQESQTFHRPPDSYDIARVVTEYAKRQKRYAILSRSLAEQPTLIPAAQAISVQDNAQLVYLHCWVMLQRGRTDFIVTDGFGLGFSEMFADHLNRQNFKWLVELKKDALRKDIGTGQDAAAETLPQSPASQYPEVFKKLAVAKEIIRKSGNADSTNRERNRESQIEFAIKGLYDAVEWALRYVLMQFPADNWQKLWARQDNDEATRLLHRLAGEKVGFDVDRHSKGVLRVQRGKIGAIEYGQVELHPLLALTIAAASENPHHPLKLLARRHPDSLHKIARLKKQRDVIQHGNPERRRPAPEQLQEYYQQVSEFMHILLPRLEKLQSGAVTRQPSDDIDQLRMSASIALDQALGQACVFHLKKLVVEDLLMVEVLLQKHQVSGYSAEIRLRLVNLYANILQQVFHEASGNKPPLSQDEAAMPDWVGLLADMQVITDRQLIPRSLSSIKKDKVLRALNGEDCTLGANFVALILRTGAAGGEAWYSRLPEILACVNQVLVLRGHGNRASPELIALPAQALVDLRNQVFTIIKTLKEN